MSRRVSDSAINGCLFYFTCGQAHSHLPPAGLIWDKNSVLEVLANDLNQATSLVVKYFGLNWSFSHEAKQEIKLHFYPSGVIGWRRWQRQYEMYLPLRDLKVGDMVVRNSDKLCIVITPQVWGDIRVWPGRYSLPPAEKADESADYEALYRVIMAGVPPGRRVMCFIDNKDGVRDICLVRPSGDDGVDFSSLTAHYMGFDSFLGMATWCERRRVRWYLLKDVTESAR